MKKKIVNTYYALIYEFIIIPFLCFLSFMIYDSLAYTPTLINNFSLYVLLITGLIIFNIAVIYVIAYVYNKVYKVDINYYTLVGILTIGIVIWFKVFWSFMEITNCKELSNDRCFESIQNNRISNYVLIASISYFILYSVIHRMIAKKLKLKKVKKSANKDSNE